MLFNVSVVIDLVETILCASSSSVPFHVVEVFSVFNSDTYNNDDGDMLCVCTLGYC